MSNVSKQKMRRRLTGVIVSDKMMQTAVVQISRVVQHPKYKKYYTVTTRFKAHNEGDAYRMGEKVVIEETAPRSKDKRWNIVERIGVAAGPAAEREAENT